MTPFSTKVLSLCSSMLLMSLLAMAQPQEVSFSLQTNLLGPITGFGINDCAVDMNGDYLDDIVRVAGTGLNIDFQQADGSFVHQFFPVDFENSPSWSICAGDFDGNGLNDLLFGGGSSVSFVMAGPDGTYYTEDEKPEYIFSQRSTLFDIDNDGHLDAFVCHDIDQSHPYRNDGTGYLIEDQSLIETVNLPGNYAAIWVDYDNDNDGDLYITKCRGGASPGDPARTNGLYRNNGDGTFTEVGAEAGVDDNAQSWATVFEDFDNDGDFDAFIVNHDFQNRFYLNNGDGTFTDIIGDTGIEPLDLGAWENASGDFNNDGFVDIFSELDNGLYLNNGDLTFTGQNIPFDEGGIGDFNNDGFLDVVRGSNVWLNEGNQNNWVKINTQGLVSNKNGIGARVEIYGEWGMQVREVRSGQSFSPMSSLTVHFGIGEATAIDQIVIRWPSGIVTSYEDPAINTTHNLIESSCLLAPAPLEFEGETILCPDEAVTLSAPEGFETYIWSNGANSDSIMVSEPGVYSVVAFDADGCASISEDITFTRAVEPEPVLLTEDNLTFCEGGSVTLTVSEGNNPVWSNGMSGNSIEVAESGEYYVSVDAVCSDEPIASEALTVASLTAPAPIVEDPQLDGALALLTASGDSLFWYAVAEGGEPVGEGVTYITPPLMEGSNFYYVESLTVFGGEEQIGGKPTPEGPGGLTVAGGFSYFDAFEDFTINTVEVFVPDNSEAGLRTIQLFDSEDNMLEERIFDLDLGMHTLELNWEIAEGMGYSLRCAENSLFRNNGQVMYPYPIGTVGELTTSFYGEDYYYYFYNWQVQKPSFSCISERVVVEIVFVDTDELPDVSGVQVFPNPTAERLMVRFSLDAQRPLQIDLQDALGRNVIQQSVNRPAIGENNYELDVSRLPAGVYQLMLRMDDQVASWKVVVE